MTHLFNDPTAFAAQLRAGYAAAYGDWVTEVRGGVVRTTATVAGEVAVINGGGSGHYPAFAGLVGPGLVHGTAMGDLFASPSSAQIVTVAREAMSDAGVLFVVANYAGDVLNFAEAAELLRAEGANVETVYITDDISSAPANSMQDRRGVAGGLAVYKAAGAAAARGLPLGEVAHAARQANSRTRTLGLAFGGCTFPGAAAPHFTVPDGMMALGMGIHGEPGIEMIPMGSADDVADLLVSRLLRDLPECVEQPDGQRAVVVLNGLGSVKYEELFVTYGAIDRLLAGQGVTIVQPEVGEFVTSFDMAGLSLTIVWLDDNLESLWAAPASSAGYRKGSVESEAGRPRRVVTASRGSAIRPGTAESRQIAHIVVDALEAAAHEISKRVDELGQLDSVAGDGDHGIGMHRGIAAALEAARDAVEHGAGARTTLGLAGEAWADRGAGTSGALWGTMLRTFASHLDDESSINGQLVVNAAMAAGQAVIERGGASPGDKTMVDAIIPFTVRLAESYSTSATLDSAVSSAAVAATDAALGTAQLVARRGRARTHADSSLGSPDPGAVSFAAIVSAIARSLENSGAAET